MSPISQTFKAQKSKNVVWKGHALYTVSPVDLKLDSSVCFTKKCLLKHYDSNMKITFLLYQHQNMYTISNINEQDLSKNIINQKN